MPRIFDYDNDDKNAKAEAYGNGAPFAALPARRSGRNEVDLSVLWGPRGIFFMDGERHQFERTVGYPLVYRNMSADDAFDWLDANIVGRWHWFERACNHGHSVTTNVWIEDDADILLFQEKYPDDFRFKSETHERNKERRADLAAVPPNKLPPGLTQSLVALLFITPDDVSLNYLSGLQTKRKGAELIANAMVHAGSGFHKLSPEVQEQMVADVVTFINGHATADTKTAISTTLKGNDNSFAEAVLAAMTPAMPVI